jgi:hypothetical protein
LDLGIGREAPKELREPLRSFIDGETLRLCMYLAASEMEDLVAGTSTGPSPESPGMGIASPAATEECFLIPSGTVVGLRGVLARSASSILPAILSKVFLKGWSFDIW